MKCPRFWSEEGASQHTLQLLDYRVTFSLTESNLLGYSGFPHTFVEKALQAKSLCHQGVPLFEEVDEDCPALICLRSNFVSRRKTTNQVQGVSDETSLGSVSIKTVLCPGGKVGRGFSEVKEGD